MLKRSVGIATIALACMAGGQAMADSSDDIDDFRSTGRSATEWRLLRNDRIHAIKVMTSSTKVKAYGILELNPMSMPISIPSPKSISISQLSKMVSQMPRGQASAQSVLH
jgi:hypothetical protein